MAVGVSLNLCQSNRAVCVEMQGKVQYDRMISTVQLDESHFGTVSDNCNYGSVGCSHWNQFLHAVKDRCSTYEQSLMIPDGDKIDTDRLYQSDPNLKALCEGGLTWSVISSKVTDVYPLVPDVFQRALNIEHHVAEGESWKQQLLMIAKHASKIAKTTSTGTKIDWDAVARHTRQSVPPCVEDIPVHIAFALG